VSEERRWQKAKDAAGSLRGRTRPGIVAAVVVTLAAVSATLVWANTMVTPVHRIGQPTVASSPTPSATTASATPTPTPSVTPSPSSTPTPSPSKTPKMKSSGTFTNATVSVNAAGSAGTLRTYTVRTETSSGLDANKMATQIAAVLNDPRSWTGKGGVRFALVADPAKASFTITLASPATAAKSCATVSGTCLVGTEVVLDALAWKNTAATYAGSAGDWHAYLANHGVGTMLGKKPASCAKAGKPAPVMMAQQVSLGGCTANAWPYP
jgi:hypothetical protein